MPIAKSFAQLSAVRTQLRLAVCRCSLSTPNSMPKGVRCPSRAKTSYTAAQLSNTCSHQSSSRDPVVLLHHLWPRCSSRRALGRQRPAPRTRVARSKLTASRSIYNTNCRLILRLTPTQYCHVGEMGLARQCEHRHPSPRAVVTLYWRR